MILCVDGKLVVSLVTVGFRSICGICCCTSINFASSDQPGRFERSYRMDRQ